MTVENFARLKLVQELNMPDAVIANNIFYMKADFQAPQSSGNVVTACEAWIEAVYAGLAALVHSGVSLSLLTVYLRNIVTYQWDVVGTADPTMAFTSGESMLPHGVCMLVRAYTEFGRTIGRKYLAGFVETACDDGAWNAGALTGAALFAAAWNVIEEVSANNFLIPGVYSSALEYVYELNGVTVVLADPAYQRRRRPGVGT
jgi:hypothetical protein